MYAWASGQVATPERFSALMAHVVGSVKLDR